MNYTRRPNRPDSNVYRQMRRGGMRSPRARTAAISLHPKILVAAAVLLAIVIVAWFVWK